MTFARSFFAAGLLAAALSVGAQPATKTYIVQLADAPVATYQGGVAGLAATRPIAGRKLDISAGHVRAYLGYLNRRSTIELARIGSAPVVHRYGLAFNGFAAQLTDAQVAALKSSTGVLAVVEQELRKMDTIHTPEFLGLSKPGGLWSQLDALGQPVKGENIIIGVVDSGTWPEDPSFGDRIDGSGKPLPYNVPGGTSAYGAAPAKWHGVCQAGPGFTAAMCNNKLIGARYYVAGFDAGGGTLTSFEYRSPRAGGGNGGHGVHTSSTAGGNSNVDASVDGVPVGVMSGIAPRARIASYKICWEATTTAATGCYNSDALKAIDDAVADGVDVINFSISGSQTSFVDPTEIAFFNAAAAGIFVAVSGGNAGPANTVGHPSPWLATVAASTHDRKTLGDLTLGNGAVYTGASTSQSAVTAPMVLSSAIPAAGVAVADANLCFLNSLDPAGAAGKIVVCDRGTNARVEKSLEVKRAGGVGMVLLNVSAAADDLVSDFHIVPTVHLPLAVRAPVRAYAATAGATGTISRFYNDPAVVAPVMAAFSSRGPNLANANILKPDITGPGVDIIAAWVDNSLTQAQHDALLLNNFTPQANANQISGTSMSSPHVAGVAALLKQQHPTWSPATIKSALMTTTNGVKLANGSPDPNRFGYGAGHLNPNPAGDPGLVYDIATADYVRFLCGLNLTPPAGAGTCATLGSIQPYNLNLASLTAANVIGTATLTRKVTNVSAATSTYVATASLPGWNVVVAPTSLTIAPGASATYTVALTRTSAALNTWSFGALAWNDNVHTVTSPLTALAAGFIAPAEVSDTRARGTKVYTIVSTYTGSMGVTGVGLVPATRTPSTVAQNARRCLNTTIPAGAQVARFQLFDEDTQQGGTTPTDLDLDVFNGPNGTGTNVGSSGGPTAAEVVTLKAPSAGTYSACVTGFATPGGAGASFTLSTWVVGPASGVQTLKAGGPSSVYASGSASIALGWNVPAGVRYLGNVTYTDPASASLGSTIVYVDAH